MLIVFNLVGTTCNKVINNQGVPAILPGITPLPATRLIISGLTRDGVTQVAIPGCTVSLFRTLDNFCFETVISDGSGAYSFSAIGLSETYYVTAYTAAGDLAGITLNTLVGA